MKNEQSYAVILKPFQPAYLLPLEKIPELETLQELVGGCIKIVPTKLKLGKTRVLMVINEEGKLEGLDMNPEATAIYKHSGDCIAGTAVLLADAGEELECVSSDQGRELQRQIHQAYKEKHYGKEMEF